MTFRRAGAVLIVLSASIVPPATTSSAAAAGSTASLCHPPADTVNPAITRVTFAHRSVDLAGTREQAMTVDVSDTSGDGRPSGVTSIRAELDSNNSVAGLGPGTAGPLFHLSSGTPESGRWTARYTVSDTARAGQVHITALTVRDAAGNVKNYPEFSYAEPAVGPDALVRHPALDKSFAMTGKPVVQQPRTLPSPLTDFALGKTRVDSTSVARTVPITARFGTATPPTRVAVLVRSAARSERTRYLRLRSTLQRHGKLWTGSVRVPAWVGRQQLRVGLYEFNGSGSRQSVRNYHPGSLEQLHFPSRVSVVSGTDHSDPELTSLVVSPKAADSTDADAKVTVTAQAHDTGSGVHHIYVTAQDQRFVTTQLSRTADGRWTGTLDFPRCISSGTYALSAVLIDGDQNYGRYSTEQLAAAGQDSSIPVTSQQGDVSRPFVQSFSTSGTDHTITLNFDEGVENITTSTLLVYPLSPAATRFTEPADVTAIRCLQGTATVDCSGASGLATSAVLTVPSYVEGDSYDVYANQHQILRQVTDGNGNPLDWNVPIQEIPEPPDQDD